MEAAALVATQKLQSGDLFVPELQVSFPFPGVFSEAKKAISQYFSDS